LFLFNATITTEAEEEEEEEEEEDRREWKCTFPRCRVHNEVNISIDRETS
jgi:hypothetical protein